MTNHEGILINDEARMTNAEGMTKSEARKPGSANDSFPNEDAEWVIREQPEKNRVYDLEERTALFGEAVIDFAKTIPHNPVTNRLINQVVGAAEVIREKTNERHLVHYSSFVILSCFIIRISSF